MGTAAHSPLVPTCAKYKKDTRYVTWRFLTLYCHGYNIKPYNKPHCIQSDTCRLPPGGYCLHYNNSDISGSTIQNG